MIMSNLTKPSQVRVFIYKFGMYAGLRHAKNIGVPFSIAHYAALGKLPRSFK